MGEQQSILNYAGAASSDETPLPRVSPAMMLILSLVTNPVIMGIVGGVIFEGLIGRAQDGCCGGSYHAAWSGRRWAC